MAKAIELRESTGTSVRRQWGRSATAGWFTRIRKQDARFGWVWTRWEPAGPPPPVAPSSQQDCDDGFTGYGSMPAGQYVGNVRLPA